MALDNKRDVRHNTRIHLIIQKEIGKIGVNLMGEKYVRATAYRIGVSLG